MEGGSSEGNISNAPLAKPRARTLAVPEEGYTQMTHGSSGGYLVADEYIQMTGNIRLAAKKHPSGSLLSLADARSTSTTFTTVGGSARSSQQNVSQAPSTLQLHIGGGDMGSSRQKILQSETDLSPRVAGLKSPVDPTPYTIGNGTEPPDTRYQNALGQRYQDQPAATGSNDRSAEGKNKNIGGESCATEAPLYGEINPQYSVIGPSGAKGSGANTRRVDSVLYGNRTAERRRRKRRRSHDKDDDDGDDMSKLCGSKTILLAIFLVLVLLCIASLGLSIYLLISRKDCACGQEANAPATSAQVSNLQAELNSLQTRVINVETSAPGGVSASNQLNALNATLSAQVASAEQRLSADQSSIASLQQVTSSNTALANSALANVSALAAATSLSPQVGQAVQNSFTRGLLFQNCTTMIRTCAMQASFDNSQELCDTRGNPLFPPAGYQVTGVACEVNLLTLVSYMVRHNSPAGPGYSCNCRFHGTTVRKDDEARCVTRLYACRMSNT